MMSRGTVSDIPAQAHAKAVLALDEFDALATEYSVLLDIQRAMLINGNVAGIAETVVRGDAVARAAAACGRRLAPHREALNSHNYQGARARELSRRLAMAGVRTDTLAAAAARLEALCIRERDRCALELHQAGSTRTARGTGTSGYRSSAIRPLALDTRA
jgi:hypothetical protein